MICLSEEGCRKNNVSIGEVLLLLCIYHEAGLCEKELIRKGYITAAWNELFENIGWRVTKKGAEILDAVIVDSGKKTQPDERLSYLAERLKEIFPKGKKDGTNYYWTEGKALISRRLKLFFKKYGNSYTDEQIIKAAEKYVKSFNGDYRYMRLLKYFILKEKVGANGEIEGDSELISYIENNGEEESLKDNWTSTLK